MLLTGPVGGSDADHRLQQSLKVRIKSYFSRIRVSEATYLTEKGGCACDDFESCCEDEGRDGVVGPPMKSKKDSLMYGGQGSTFERAESDRPCMPSAGYGCV